MRTVIRTVRASILTVVLPPSEERPELVFVVILTADYV